MSLRKGAPRTPLGVQMDAVMPCYRSTHLHGPFVFVAGDAAQADAAQLEKERTAVSSRFAQTLELHRYVNPGEVTKETATIRLSQ